MTNHPGPIIAARDGLQVVNCHNCGYAHLTELPTDVALAEYYGSTFWAEKGRGWRARYEAERDWNAAKNGDWLTVMEAHTLGRTLLDIGAGYGLFLQDAAARGWAGVGLEPSAEASEYARAHGANVITETWQTHWPTCRYDAITAFWLLEHLPAPLDFLRWCRRQLFTGGVLALAVPNEWNQFQSFANEDGKCLRDFFVHSSHCNYFNPAALGNLLGCAGFRVVDWLATWPIDFELLQGHDYTRDDAVGERVHAYVREQELSMNRDDRLTRGRMLARQALGRDLVVFAKAES